MRREGIAAVICVSGIIFGFLFCADIGLYILDVMDYYINGYTLLIVGILQCVALGWVYEVDEVVKKGVPIKAIWIYSLSFWIPLVGGVILGLFAAEGYEWIGVLIHIIFWTIGIIVSSSVAKQNGWAPKQFLSEISLCGIRKIARHITILSH
jgi:NSS family neurotransmitter:Na+ symporter